MPDRFLRDDLLTSSRWNDLPVEVQNLYVRLLLVADDFGCFDGRPGVVSSQCYPLKPIEADVVEAMLVQLHTVGLIVRYSNAGKPFIAILRWKQQLRGRRRFPAPPVDVDVPEAKTKGKYDREIGWRNPPGYDDISILLDVKARPVSPQPEEWRDPSHYGPEVELEDAPQVQPRGRTDGKTRGATRPMLRVPTDRRSDRGSVGPVRPTDSQEKVVVDVKQEKEADAVVADADGVVIPMVRPAVDNSSPTATATNGVIGFNGKNFEGLTEAQRVEWQEMFDDLRIPDQVARAAAWLAVHPEECAAIRSQGGDPFGSFIVRWLLRESKPQSPHTGHASPTTETR